MIINGTSTTNEAEIANGYCSFFHTAIENIKKNTIKLKDFVWSSQRPPATTTTHRFKFRYISVPEVKTILRQINMRKSAGPDGIPARLIKDCAYELSSPIAHLLNVILETSIIPNDFKIGRVTAIYKNGERSQLNNYRPITVLPIVSKIMERCIYNQLTEYLEKNNLLSARQFGFRKGKSTEMAANLFFDDVYRAMNRGQLTGTLFVDLSKAFDTVSHSILLSKLYKYGIREQENELFADYLFNRWQYLEYKSATSTHLPVYGGVPQGSILGPLLFLLFFNDAEQQLVRCKIVTYADDTIIYFHSDSLKEIEHVLQNEFTFFSNWLIENELILNMNKNKTEIMIFGTQKRLNKTSRTVNIVHQNEYVNNTNYYNYLVIKVDPSLNLINQFQAVYKTASSRLRLLQKVRKYVTKNAALRIYEALILSKVMYCSMTNYFHQNYRQNLLSLFESRAKIIIDPAISKFPSIEQLHKKKICKFVRKCLDGKEVNFINHFELINHRNNTRNNNCSLRLPFIKLESTKKALFFNGPFIYNNMALR